MKGRWLLLLVAAAALSVGLGAAAPASATPGKGAATPFKASYGPLPDFYTYAHFDCSGAHIVNPGMVKDSETCLLTGDTSDLVAGTYSGDPWITLPWVTFPTRWSSDYDGALATHATQTFVDNEDGTWTMYVVAYY